MPTALLENRLTKTEDRLDRLEQLILQQSINATKGQQETAELRIELAKTNQRMDEGFAELRNELAKTNQRMDEGFAEFRNELAKTNQRMDEGFAEFRETIAQTKKETAQGFAEFRKSQEQGFAEFRKSQEQGFAEFRKSQEQGFAEFRESQKQGAAELRRSQKQLTKQLGELSNRLGTIVEDLVAPSLERIFFEVTGITADSEILLNVRIKKRHPVTREIREFDAVVESEKYLLVNETKSQLKPEDIPKFLEALAEFYSYFPEHEDKGLTIIGAMSSMHLDSSLITALSKQGLVALAIGDDITTIKNPQGFKYKAF